jgi:hypothetical protein
MSALDDLRKLGQFPAVEKYQFAKGEFIPHPLTRKADAAIEELAEFVTTLSDGYQAANEVGMKRAEQAEAEVARLEWMLEHFESIGNTPEYRADLAAPTSRGGSHEHH